MNLKWFPFNRVDGGVSKNDFICQLLADLTKLKVERARDSELSALGVGFLAGLNTGKRENRIRCNLHPIELNIICRNLEVPRRLGESTSNRSYI